MAIQFEPLKMEGALRESLVLLEKERAVRKSAGLEADKYDAAIQQCKAALPKIPIADPRQRRPHELKCVWVNRDAYETRHTEAATVTTAANVQSGQRVFLLLNRGKREPLLVSEWAEIPGRVTLVSDETGQRYHVSAETRLIAEPLTTA